jgi:hypothetical protein
MNESSQKVMCTIKDLKRHGGKKKMRKKLKSQNNKTQNPSKPKP